jgi:hypothetical protein
MQRPHRLARGLESRIQPVSLLQRLGIQVDDRIDIRALLVVSLDARQIGGDHLMRGELAVAIGGLDIGDAGLLDLERMGVGSAGEHDTGED